MSDRPSSRHTERFRIGHGYDAHRLVEGRPLVIGGVIVPHRTGLEGHSDADVLTHAVMDALLGAAALGDIGRFFSSDDPAFAGVSSLVLLGHVREMLVEAGWRLENLDSTIVAQAPRLSPHTQQMREKLAETLLTDTARVSVKATTTDRLGPWGREEGIAAHAVCIIYKA